MTTLVAPFFAISEDRQHITIVYGCTCGWRSEPRNVGEPGDPARYAVRCHLADEHSAEFEVGRCGVCGEPTDYFVAHFPRPDGATVEIEDAYLCEMHAPTPIVLDQAEPDEPDEPDEEAGAPFDVLHSGTLRYYEGIES